MIEKLLNDNQIEVAVQTLFKVLQRGKTSKSLRSVSLHGLLRIAFYGKYEKNFLEV